LTLACYGGEIDTANLDRLAPGGLRFTQFYNAGRFHHEGHRALRMGDGTSRPRELSLPAICAHGNRVSGGMGPAVRN
jgi:arylsulfatase